MMFATQPDDLQTLAVVGVVGFDPFLAAHLARLLEQFASGNGIVDGDVRLDLVWITKMGSPDGRLLRLTTATSTLPSGFPLSVSTSYEQSIPFLGALALVVSPHVVSVLALLALAAYT